MRKKHFQRKTIYCTITLKECKEHVVQGTKQVDCRNCKTVSYTVRGYNE